MKKKIALVLSSVFILSAFLSSCGGTTDLSSTTSGDKSGEETVNSGSDAENSELPTLKIAVSLDPRAEDPNDMVWEQEYNKSVGVNVEYITLPSDAAGEKKNLMLASGDLPDVFMGLLNRTDIMMYKDQGLFLPVNDLIESDMPLLKEIYENYPEYKTQATAPDGNMYGFPRIEEMFGLVLNQGILSINQGWLDNLGLPMPTTLDEFRDTLTKFIEEDANGNGIADEIGLTFAGKGSNKAIGNWVNPNDIGQFLGCFGQVDRGDSLFLDENDDIFFTANTESFKEGYKYFHEMYASGLIDTEIYTMDDSALAAKLRDPADIVGAAMNFAIADRVDTERLKDFAPVPYLTGPNGEFGCRENTSEMSNPVNFVITKNCTDPVAAAKYADGTYDPVKSVEANWGPLDFVYKFDENGMMVWGELQEGYDNVDDMRAAKILSARHPLAIFDEYYNDVVQYPENAQYLLDTMETVGFIDKHLNDSYIPPLWFSTEDASRLAILQTQIFENVVDPTRRGWIVDGGVDEGWDQYIEDLESAGLDEFIEIVQKTYDASK